MVENKPEESSEALRREHAIEAALKDAIIREVGQGPEYPVFIVMNLTVFHYGSVTSKSVTLQAVAGSCFTEWQAKIIATRGAYREMSDAPRVGGRAMAMVLLDAAPKTCIFTFKDSDLDDGREDQQMCCVIVYPSGLKYTRIKWAFM